VKKESIQSNFIDPSHEESIHIASNELFEEQLGVILLLAPGDEKQDIMFIKNRKKIYNLLVIR
jgi:hypothetical protein